MPITVQLTAGRYTPNLLWVGKDPKNPYIYDDRSPELLSDSIEPQTTFATGSPDGAKQSFFPLDHPMTLSQLLYIWTTVQNEA